jgi:hypothetical protein
MPDDMMEQLNILSPEEVPEHDAFVKMLVALQRTSDRIHRKLSSTNISRTVELTGAMGQMQSTSQKACGVYSNTDLAVSPRASELV